MPRTNFEEVDRLPDPLLMFNWDMIIPIVPGVTGYDAVDFKTRVQTSEVPGRFIEPVLQDLHGVSRETAGRAQSSRTLNFSIMETRDLRARDTLQAWHRYCRNDSSLGTYYNEYSTTVQMLLYDDHDNVIRNISYHRAWLEQFTEYQLDGGASQAVSIQGTLKFFRWTEE